MSATMLQGFHWPISIRAKMIGRSPPLLYENLADTDPPLAKRPFSIYFRS